MASEDSIARPVEGDAVDEGLEELPGYDRIHQLLVRELGEEMAQAFARSRHARDAWARERHPTEGLRERKKRVTRQRISDVATTLFVVRGFENVKVSEVAEAVGVSEKTIFNYFPTKEAMVFDEADEAIEQLTAALRKRQPGEPPTRAVLRALERNLELHAASIDEFAHFFMSSFAEMVAATPSLRAAWLELQNRLAEVAMDELAAGAEIDPRDPEPTIAARALVGLVDVAYEAQVRHTEAGLRGERWRTAVLADVERAARLLETGLWSFHLLTQGARTRKQIQEAAAAAEQARKQVLEALDQARSAWRALRGQEHAERYEYRAFRETLRERQRAIREQQAHFREAMRESQRAIREQRAQLRKQRGG